MYGDFIKVSCPICGEEIFWPVEIERLAIDRKFVLKLKKGIKTSCQACQIEFKIPVYKEITFISVSVEGSIPINTGSLFFPCLCKYCKGRIRVPVVGEKAYPVFPTLKEANRRKKETETGLISLRFGGKTVGCDCCGEAGEVLPVKIYFEIRKISEKARRRFLA